MNSFLKLNSQTALFFALALTGAFARAGEPACLTETRSISSCSGQDSSGRLVEAELYEGRLTQNPATTARCSQAGDFRRGLVTFRPSSSSESAGLKFNYNQRSGSLAVSNSSGFAVGAKVFNEPIRLTTNLNELEILGSSQKFILRANGQITGASVSQSFALAVTLECGSTSGD